MGDRGSSTTQCDRDRNSSNLVFQVVSRWYLTNFSSYFLLDYPPRLFMFLIRPLLSGVRISVSTYSSARIWSQSPLANSTATLHLRLYASKAKATKSTATLIPGSQKKLTDESAIEEYEKAEKKMQAAVEWYRKEVAGLETRASGRVTPALLAPVRVTLPDSEGESLRLEEVATVGVREGSTLLVTVFDENVSASLCFCSSFDC
jgi:hypothetical protein